MMLGFLTNVAFTYHILHAIIAQWWQFLVTDLDVVSENRCLIMAFSSSFSDCSNDSTRYINNENEAAELLYSPVEAVFYSIIVPCIMAVSFLSNSAFIFAVYRQPELRTITNAYLVNVAVADIIYVEVNGFVHFVFPYMMSPLKLAIHFGQSECILHAFRNIFYYTSFLLITCVAVERFLAICHPLYQRMVSGKSRTIKIIIASWLLGGIFAVGLQVLQRAHLKTSCIVWPDGDKYVILPAELSTCETYSRFPHTFECCRWWSLIFGGFSY